MTNNAHIKGEVVTGFEFSHSVSDINYYRTNIKSYRQSGIADTIPVIVSDKLVDINCDWTGYVVDIEGEFRSHNITVDGKRRLSLFVFAFDWVEDEMGGSENEIYLDGYIGKVPIYRKLSRGREITDILLAVNRGDKTDYIPCILWGGTARMAAEFGPGKHIRINGRIQSRTYCKGDAVNIAYEVSAGILEVVD